MTADLEGSQSKLRCHLGANGFIRRTDPREWRVLPIRLPPAKLLSSIPQRGFVRDRSHSCHPEKSPSSPPLGAAIARELAAGGYALALLSPSGAAEKLAGELGALGMTGSVTEPADLDRLVDATMARHGRIDAVVNNTGGVPKGELLDHDDEVWHASLDMVLLNVVRMARLVTPVMRAQGGGAIVNISTFSAFEPSLDYPYRARCAPDSGASPSSTPNATPLTTSA